MGMADELRDQPPDTLTRSQLLTMRGYPPEVIEGNGHKPEPDPVPVPVAAPAQQLCQLPGCSQPVAAGRGAKYCSPAHRRKGHDVRRPKEQLLTRSSPADFVPVVGAEAPWQALAEVAHMVPDGWQLVATAGSISLTWQSHEGGPT